MKDWGILKLPNADATFGLEQLRAAFDHFAQLEIQPPPFPLPAFQLTADEQRQRRALQHVRTGAIAWWNEQHR